MKSQCFVVMLVGVIFWWGVQAIYAGGPPPEGGVQTNVRAAENVGNTVCPVWNEPIDETTKVTFEYNGKIYNFCCPGCIEEFKKNPQQYIEKLEQKKQ